MIPISFPIAHPNHPVNLLSYVILPAYLIPEDDTSGVVPRHTYLRHAYHVSATRNFRLTPPPTPPSLRDLSPLPPPTSVCLVPYATQCAEAWPRRRTRRRMSNPRPVLPYSYSLVSRETCEDTQQPAQQREDSTCARAARSFVAAFVLAALVLRRRRSCSSRAHGAVELPAARE